MEQYDFQLKDGDLKVKVISVDSWYVKTIRSDNSKEDYFPIQYFKRFFKVIDKS